MATPAALRQFRFSSTHVPSDHGCAAIAHALDRLTDAGGWPMWLPDGNGVGYHVIDRTETSRYQSCLSKAGTRGVW